MLALRCYNLGRQSGFCANFRKTYRGGRSHVRWMYEAKVPCCCEFILPGCGCALLGPATAHCEKEIDKARAVGGSSRSGTSSANPGSDAGISSPGFISIRPIDDCSPEFNLGRHLESGPSADRRDGRLSRKRIGAGGGKLRSRPGAGRTDGAAQRIALQLPSTGFSDRSCRFGSGNPDGQVWRFRRERCAAGEHCGD